MARRPLYMYIILFTIFCLGLFRYFYLAQPPPEIHLQPWKDSDATMLLNTNKCEKTFPGLFDEVDRAARGRWGKKITSTDLDQIELRNGYIRGMIYNQEV